MERAPNDESDDEFSRAVEATDSSAAKEIERLKGRLFAAEFANGVLMFAVLLLVALVTLS